MHGCSPDYPIVSNWVVFNESDLGFEVQPQLLLNMAAPENTKMTHLHYIAKGISHPSKAPNSGVPVTSMGQIASTNVCESTGRYQEPGTSVVP